MGLNSVMHIEAYEWCEDSYLGLALCGAILVGGVAANTPDCRKCAWIFWEENGYFPPEVEPHLLVDPSDDEFDDEEDDEEDELVYD